MTIAYKLLKDGDFISKKDIADVFEKEYPDEIKDDCKGEKRSLTNKPYINSLKHAVEDIQKDLKKKGTNFRYVGKGRSRRFAFPEDVSINKLQEEKAYKNRISFLQSLLKNAITEGYPLSMTYSARYKKLKEIELHPYRLKVYNNRMFVVGLGIEDGKQYEDCIFALDRIMNAKKSNTKYIRPQKDYAHFFDDIVGVTHVKGRKRQTVKIATQGKYTHYRILTKPIHRSQKEIEPCATDDGEGVITINVIPNFELRSLLLSFGPDIRLISPPELVKDIKKQILKMLENYNIDPSESD